MTCSVSSSEGHWATEAKAMDRAKQRKRRKTRRWCGCEAMWEGSGQGQSPALLLPLLLEPGQATREACQSLHSPVL